MKFRFWNVSLSFRDPYQFIECLNDLRAFIEAPIISLEWNNVFDFMLVQQPNVGSQALNYWKNTLRKDAEG